MVMDTSGWISEKILLIGRREYCAYLVKGNDEYALIGGGTSHIIPDILEQLDRFDIPEDQIRTMIILHSHFDHCGIIPFFKKRWPRAAVAASDRARTLLSTPKVVQSIAQLNQSLISSTGREDAARSLGIEFPGITVEQVLKDGDMLMCGGVRLEVMEVPGHSSCSIAVYMPDEKALFASDAGGIPLGDAVFTAANSNFDQYMASLDKMSGRDVDIHLAEHYGARTGTDGRLFLKKAKASAIETRKILEASYARTRDIEQSTREITHMLMADSPVDYFPQEIISLVVGQMLAFIAKQYH
jgi:glyoxylase-like metal-dependent hydrolase (beta-lactamase superfamily II)